MVSNATTAVKLVQPELALDAYLQALLATVPEYTQSVAAEVDLVIGDADLEQIPLEVESAIEVSAEAAAPVVVSSQPSEEFHALFFRIGGLTLATPVSGVKRIVGFEVASTTVTSLPNQPSWLLGLVDSQEGALGVMHTAELLLGSEKAMRRNFDTHPYSKIIISRHGRYGFACDEVLEMIKLHTSDVSWNRARDAGFRPWFMGTVTERLSVLVDLAELTPIKR